MLCLYIVNIQSSQFKCMCIIAHLRDSLCRSITMIAPAIFADFAYFNVEFFVILFTKFFLSQTITQRMVESTLLDRIRTCFKRALDFCILRFTTEKICLIEL